MSHRGQNSAVGTYQKWDGAKWVPTKSGLVVSAESYPIALANLSEIAWSGAAAGFGNLFCSRFIPPADLDVTQGMFASTIAPGGGGGTAVGIYAADGTLLRRTAIQIGHAVGFVTANWASGGALTLTANTSYFLALYSNMNGAEFLNFGPALTPPASTITLGFSVPNSGSLDASGFPADVSEYFSTPTTNRFWSQVK